MSLCVVVVVTEGGRRDTCVCPCSSSQFLSSFLRVCVWCVGRGERWACVRSKRPPHHSHTHSDTQPQPQRHTTNQPATQFDSRRENSPGPDTARIDRLIALS